MKTTLLILILVLVASFLTDATYGTTTAQPEWDRLSFKWRVWNDHPLDSDTAISKGYSITSSCQSDTYFEGNRFTLNGNDFSTSPIYNYDGLLVGVQSAVKNPIRNGDPPYVLDGSLYTLTVYFVDPATVCHKQQNPNYDNANLLWDRVWLLNGKQSKKARMGPSAYVSFPINETDADSNGWVKGNCLPTMGSHYTFNSSKTQDCDTLFPMFIMYNSGVLTTFAFYTLDSPEDDSNNWETPGIKGFAQTYYESSLPTCISQIRSDAATRIMHTYLSSPWLDLC